MQTMLSLMDTVNNQSPSSTLLCSFFFYFFFPAFKKCFPHISCYRSLLFLFPWTFSKFCLHLSWSTYNWVQCSTHRAELWRIITFHSYLTHLEIHSKFLRPQKTAPRIQFVISCYPRCFLQYYCLASYSPFYIVNSVPFINTACFCSNSNHFFNLPWSFWHLLLPSKGCQTSTHACTCKYTHIYIRSLNHPDVRWEAQKSTAARTDHVKTPDTTHTEKYDIITPDIVFQWGAQPLLNFTFHLPSLCKGQAGLDLKPVAFSICQACCHVKGEN